MDNLNENYWKMGLFRFIRIIVFLSYFHYPDCEYFDRMDYSFAQLALGLDPIHIPFFTLVP